MTETDNGVIEFATIEVRAPERKTKEVDVIS